MTSKLDLSALRQFAEAIDEDSSILFLPELSFLRKSLSKYGDLKPIPERDDNLDGEEENDDDIPDLDESPELNAGFTSSFVPETKYENEPEDVDPELISPDPMPYLPIPTGGEGNLRISNAFTTLTYLSIISRIYCCRLRESGGREGRSK